MPHGLKKGVCELIAFFVYLPFVGVVKLLQFFMGKQKWINKIPLSYYSDKSLNIIRNDALDRFGTPLEQRFSKVEITEMLRNAGINQCTFSDNAPYWHVLGRKV